MSKAQSVDQRGAPDGFEPDSFFRAEILQGGYTRLVVSVPGSGLQRIHGALLAVLRPPFKARYVALTDRARGQLPKPKSYVAVELGRGQLEAALLACQDLVYRDGRHQLWLLDAGQAQLVLDELGMLYVYPDDPSFRDVLTAAGLAEGSGPTMAERDYVRVNFQATADAQESALHKGLGLVEWGG